MALQPGDVLFFACCVVFHGVEEVLGGARG